MIRVSVVPSPPPGRPSNGGRRRRIRPTALRGDDVVGSWASSTGAATSAAYLSCGWVIGGRR